MSEGRPETRAARRSRASDLVRVAHERIERGEFAAAVTACRAAVDAFPEGGWFYEELGHALVRRGAFLWNEALCRQMLDDGTIDEAIASYRRSVELGAGSHHLHVWLAHALTMRGDYSGAAKAFQRATYAEMAQNNPEHYARHEETGELTGPGFVIIGATKCGTTSLYEYMRNHPQVLPAIWKEIEYYRYPERGHEWYLSHFPRIPHANTRFVTGEASTCYIGMREVKSRLHADYPNTKLIALVRDPVEKAISHCHHDRKLGIERRTPNEALAEELDILEPMASPWPDSGNYWQSQRGYVWHGMYHFFLRDWMATFGKDQLLVIRSEDLYGDPEPTLRRVYAYLDLPDHKLDEYPVHLRGEYDRKREPIHDRLARFFAPHNEQLAELLGRDLHWAKPSGDSPPVDA